MKILNDAPLDKLNSMAVPAKSKALVIVTSADELVQALEYANSLNWKVLILGEGSNTVFIRDFPGLVILNRIMGIKVLHDGKQHVVVNVGSGENWHEFVHTCVNNNWFGLENLALIPGLVGAAPVQNIGAYGCELKDCLESVDFINLNNGSFSSLDAQQCQLTYRDSIFKNQLASKTAITSITLRLSKIAKLNISYPSLAEAIEGVDDPSAKLVFETVCHIRESKLPSPAIIPNAGSFFKNPVVERSEFELLKKHYPDIPGYTGVSGSRPNAKSTDVYQNKHNSQSDVSGSSRVKIPAAWLIEKAGWKGRSIGGVSVHDTQALVVINPQKKDGNAILIFAQAVQKDIRERFGVDLEIEPQLI